MTNTVRQEIEAAAIGLSIELWSSSKNHVQVPETENWASCRIECQANKDVARKVAGYIKAVQPRNIRALLSTHDADLEAVLKDRVALAAGLEAEREKVRVLQDALMRYGVLVYIHVMIEKESNTGLTYSAVQMILHSSEKLHHPPADDDRSAVTFWLPKSQHRREELASTFERMATLVRVAKPETGLD